MNKEVNDRAEGLVVLLGEVDGEKLHKMMKKCNKKEQKHDNI